MNHSKEDLVSAWFSSAKISPPLLERQVFFDFSRGGLAVSSNSGAFIKNISSRLRHYLQKDVKKITGEIIKAEIYYLEGVPIHLNSPVNCRVYKTDTFYHYQWDRGEGFWRPNDLLVSFSTGGAKTIKVLIAETAAAPVSLSGGKVLRRKGGIDWEEISDMVHMLFMRMFGVFCLHAASLIVKDKGVILTGASGSGKTTSALALIDSGAVLLSDELTLVAGGAGENPVISGIILDPRLSRSDGEKVYSIDGPGPVKENWQKTSFHLPRETAAAGLHKEVQAALILLMDLKADNPPHHIIHEVAEHEAVTALVGQVLDPSNSTRHKEIFEAIFHLVTSCSLYRLEPGRDIDGLAGFIAGLL